MKKRILSAMSLAVIAALGVGTGQKQDYNSQNNVRFDRRNKSNENRENKALTPQRNLSKSVYRPSQSLAHRDFYNAGIPPKIYGMYHVRRGTHKRTNI